MKVISVDPEVMHGTPCFAGTRVPIQALFDHLPDSLPEFYENFPSVTRVQVEALLHQMPELIRLIPAQVLAQVQ